MKIHTYMQCALCGGSTFWFLFHHHFGWSMQKCRSCGLVQVMPRPRRAEIARLYHEDMEHFEPYIEQLSVHRQYFRKKIREIVSTYQRINVSVKNNDTLTHRHIDDPLHLLDVGCAMGVLIGEAQKMGFRAEGVDISKDAVSYCKKHGMKAYAGTLGTLKMPQKTYNVISAFEVIEHEHDPMGMMRRVYKLLKKGGLVVIGTPDHNGIWRKIMGKQWFGYQHPEHLFFFDPMTITKLLTKAGFTHIEVKRDESRKFPLYFVFTRGADYFPWLGWLLVPIGKFVKRLKLINPINPWDDMIVFAKK